jgi:hypothetical protein
VMVPLAWLLSEEDAWWEELPPAWEEEPLAFEVEAEVWPDSPAFSLGAILSM